MPIAIVAGVGAERGLGAAVCRRFAREGVHVVVSGRTAAKVEAVVTAITAAGGQATPDVTDVTDEAAVVRLFDRAQQLAGGPPDVAVFNAGNNRPRPIRDENAGEFEALWRVGCFGGFLFGREAARRMVPAGRGTVIFTGATGSLRGAAGFAGFAAAKAGLRMIAQSMARELGREGIHVAHVIVDGAIDGDRVRNAWPGVEQVKGADGLLEPDDIAEAYWALHAQKRSAWTHELDVRPYREPF